MIADDTIVAISSATGPAARMIVRMSGQKSFAIFSKISAACVELPSHSATRRRVQINGLTFPVILYCFHAPRSATGEDVLEIHLPGNPFLARWVLDAASQAGARAAEPGEFTARAYFNRRIDLAAAEGISAAIAAQSEWELDAARRLLSGELSRRLRPIVDLIAGTLALIEAGIDFAGEEISVLDRTQTAGRINQIDMQLERLLAESSRFEALSHEPRIVLVGRPNAGKSTLLNCLAGIDRAIVSPESGTTRDALSAPLKLRRGMATLIDVAGLDESAGEDRITSQMQQASHRAIETADVIVLVQDVHDPRPPIKLSSGPHLTVLSKSDFAQSLADGLAVSAHTGEGIPALRDRLNDLAFGERSAASSLALNARHIRAIEEARLAITRADSEADAELIALELRDALDALGGIVGTITPDDVLGRIFSTFCIGK